MDRINFIKKIIRLMRKYQEENNVKKQCVTNVQYLYDTIKMTLKNDVKAKAIYVFSFDEDTQLSVFLGGHLIITIDDNDIVIEPSYDIYSLKNKRYFDNIKDLMDTFSNKDYVKANLDFKKIVSDHITFMKLANQINNGDLLISDREHYDNQADYVQNCINI